MSWQPPTSIASGSVLGGAFAKLLCGALTYWGHIPLDVDARHSITVICVFGVAWLFHAASQPQVPTQPAQPANKP